MGTRTPLHSVEQQAIGVGRIRITMLVHSVVPHRWCARPMWHDRTHGRREHRVVGALDAAGRAFDPDPLVPSLITVDVS